MARTRTRWLGMRRGLTAGLLCLLLTPAIAWSQDPPPPLAASPARLDQWGGAGASPAQPAAALYEQVSVGSDNVSSQNYEASLDSFDSTGADDFAIGGSYPWRITSVEIRGQYTNINHRNVDSVNVAFYANNAGLPGSLIASATLVPVGDMSGGNLVLNLAPVVDLPAGQTYWFAAQVNKNFTNTGEWRWLENSSQHGNPSAWRNPGNGFVTGCTSWDKRVANCDVGTDPDLIFRLFGVVNIYNLFLPIIMR